MDETVHAQNYATGLSFYRIGFFEQNARIFIIWNGGTLDA
jgi:hypothetical protein